MALVMSRGGMIRQQIVTVLLTAKREADGEYVVPRTELVSVEPSGAAINVADPSVFTGGQLLIWFDGTQEEFIPIQDDWYAEQGNPIPLNFTGMEYSTLQHAHAAHAVIATHLYLTAPASNAFSTSGNDPVIYLTPQSETGRRRAIPNTLEPDYNINLQYRRTLIQQRGEGADGSTLMNATTWVTRVRLLAEADMEALISALMADETLEATTMGFGPFDVSEPPVYQVQFGDVQMGDQTSGVLQAGSTAQLQVRGTWQDFEV